jgi:zinc transporter ZupT
MRMRQTIKTLNNDNLNSSRIQVEPGGDDCDESEMKIRNKTQKEKFRKILLLIIAVTVHNIPEGMAVGVGFGA